MLEPWTSSIDTRRSYHPEPPSQLQVVSIMIFTCKPRFTLALLGSNPSLPWRGSRRSQAGTGRPSGRQSLQRSIDGATSRRAQVGHPSVARRAPRRRARCSPGEMLKLRFGASSTSPILFAVCYHSSTHLSSLSTDITTTLIHQQQLFIQLFHLLIRRTLSTVSSPAHVSHCHQLTSLQTAWQTPTELTTELAWQRVLMHTSPWTSKACCSHSTLARQSQAQVKTSLRTMAAIRTVRVPSPWLQKTKLNMKTSVKLLRSIETQCRCQKKTPNGKRSVP